VREIPEAMKPRVIPIASSSKLLEVKPTQVGCLATRFYWEAPRERGAFVSGADATSTVCGKSQAPLAPLVKATRRKL
jgi:hypothetical protein